MKQQRLIDLPKEIFKLPFLERILSSLTQHKPPNHFFARLPPLNKSYARNSVRKVVRDKIAYELDISDYMEWLVFWGIRVEPRGTLYLLLSNQDCVLDVGANIGEVTLNAARIVGPGGSVHAFEPDKNVFSKITNNVNLNPYDNIRLNNFALGDKDNQEVFLESKVESNMGGSRVSYNPELGKKIKVFTIDSYVAENKLAIVDLVKIDVEGYELKVLRGACRILELHRPILFIEVDDENLKEQGDSAQSLILFLESKGYQSIIRADDQMEISSMSDFGNCHFDVIAVCANGP